MGGGADAGNGRVAGAAGGWRFTKGHGTANDFVVLPDPDGLLPLTPAVVRALCDRRSGIGADGVLRVVRTAAARAAALLPGDATVNSDAAVDAGEWFMDYRNADGSVAEMCGNGARVFARWLVREGWAPAGAWPLATRGGVRGVEVADDGAVTVDMGVPAELDTPAVVRVDGREMAGRHVSMGNPHIVVPVGSVEEAGSLLSAPAVAPPDAFPAGTNVEFVVTTGPRAVRLRVWERGVGETASCGTGACAAAVAAARWTGEGPGDGWTVDVPGGRLRVTWGPGGTVRLTGPAELVADGTVDGGFLARAGVSAGSPPGAPVAAPAR